MYSINREASDSQLFMEALVLENDYSSDESEGEMSQKNRNKTNRGCCWFFWLLCCCAIWTE